MDKSDTIDTMHLWLDCDPGHDDAMAIILAAYTNNVVLHGISTVAGNQSVIKTTKNALAVLDAIGKHEIEVVQGQEKPLVRKPQFCAEIHGESGLDKRGGHPIFPESSRNPVEGKCVNVMFQKISSIFRHAGVRVKLVCTGALTNAALLLTIYPEVLSMVDIVLMGGCYGLGNTGPVAEFNIQIDPEAASIVFGSGAHLTMVPLEVTHTAKATEEIFSSILKKGDSPFRTSILDLLLFFKDTYKEYFDFDDPPLHDPCAVAYVIAPAMFEVEFIRVDIETGSTLCAGQTVCDRFVFNRMFLKICFLKYI